MADWVTDDELYDAAKRCGAKLLEMCTDAIGDADTTPPGSLPRTIVDSLRLDAEDFMFYDPARLDEEYGRMLAVAKAIGSDPYTAADLEETKNHLVNWTGDAATAFKRQIDLMKEYCDLQQLNILQALQCVLAAGQLAIHARADYLELAEATIAAAQREIGEQSKRVATASVAVVGEIVESVLDLDPKSLITGSITMFSNVSSEITQAVIEGDDADVVIDNYIIARNQMRARYDHAFSNLKSVLQVRAEEVMREGHPLREPLPTFCHVESPDFSYERFQSSRVDGPAPITPVVEEERKKYAEEKTARGSEIDRRLNGGKGEI